MQDQNRLNQLFFALSDANRRNMLVRLLEKDVPITELAQHYEMTLPAISKHLRVLEEAELVAVTKIGRSRIVSLLPENLQDAQLWLSTLHDENSVFDKIERDINALIGFDEE